jgi:hypothetical protein
VGSCSLRLLSSFVVRLLVAIAALCAFSAADECNANIQHIAFNNLNSPLILTLLEGNQFLECVDLVVDDRTFGYMKTIQQIENNAVGDAVVLFDANNGPNGAMAANICVWSDGGIPGSNCDALGNITRQDSEVIMTGPILTKLNGDKWGVIFTSDADTDQRVSDTLNLQPVPEPAMLVPIGSAVLLLSRRQLRHLLR